MKNLVGFALKNPVAAALAIFLLLALAGGAKLKWDLWRLDQAHAQATTERDKLAANAAAERARANRWVVRFAEVEENLGRTLAEKGELAAEVGVLAADLEASRVEVRSYARALLVAEGALTSVGTPDSTAQEGTGEQSCSCPSRWDGVLDDGLLSGTWAFLAAVRLLELDYGVRLPLEWVTGTTGDGRAMLNIRSPDPRVTPFLEEYVWTPPAPVIESRCSLTRQGVVGGIGYLLGVWTGAQAGGN